MIPISLKLIQSPPSAAEIYKQTMFGTALGLTNTAKQAQKAVMHALGDTFTLRGQWFNQSQKYGIKIRPATKTNVEAVIGTAADWLAIHETGGIKTGRGGHRLAIPTENVRRRKSTGIIPTAMKPKALKLKGRTFIIQTKNGAVLFERKYKGKRSKIVALYNLEPRARIRKQSTFYEPIDMVVKKYLNENVIAGIVKAFATGGSMRGRSNTSYSPRTKRFMMTEKGALFGPKR